MAAPSSWTGFSLGSNADIRWKFNGTRVNGDVGTVVNGDVGELLVYNSAADAARVAVLASYLSSKWEQSAPVGRVTITNKQSGEYITGDTTAGSTQSVDNICRMQYLDPARAQQWIIYDIGDGYYSITTDDGLALGVAASSGLHTAGTKLVSSPWLGNYQQQWQIVESTTYPGYYTFKNRNSGLMMDVVNNDTYPGTALQQYTANTTSAQLFAINALKATVKTGTSSYVGLAAGSYTTSQLAAQFSSASAFYVPAGYQLVGYPSDSFAGTPSVLNGPTSSTASWITSVKSVKVTKFPGAPTTLHLADEGTNIGGASDYTGNYKATWSASVSVGSAGDGVQVASVPAASRLTLRYLSDYGPVVAVYVNGTQVATLTLVAKGAGDQLQATPAIDVDIPAGSTIKILRVSGSGGLQLDNIVVSS
jgi:hypothetical protein